MKVWITVCCLVSIILQVLHIAEVSGNIYGNCVKQDVTFNCSGLGLLEVPEQVHLPSVTEILDLSNNYINNVTVLIYPVLTGTLHTLNLSHNQITTLDKDAFIRLTSLVTLDLSGNLVEGHKLDEFMFNDLRKLKYLNMEKNPLRHIKENTFNFFELPALLHLDLSHCEISVMEPSSLDLPSLEYLDLSWNQLTTLDKDAFKMLTNLQVLDMSHNSIHVLNEVPYMPDLQTWILDNNGMQEIEIKEGVRDFADKLEKLFLRNNDFLRFDQDSLPLTLDSLRVIDMSGNDIHCDCKMKWIVSGEYDFTKKAYTFRCRYPSDLDNKDLITLAPEQLKCSTPLARSLFIVMISTVATLIATTVLFFVIRRHRLRKRQKRAATGDKGGHYTAVYTRDEDDIRVSMSDNKELLKREQEFDV